jgi:hypothetical protein
MSRHRNYVVQRKEDGKYWDFKDCAWVEEINDFCKITECTAFNLLKLEEEVIIKITE